MKHVILILMAVCCMASIASAQLTQTGPYGGYIICLAATGSDVFAGTNGSGLFLSTNSGASWSETSLPDNGTDNVVTALAVTDTLLVVGSLDGVYISNDGGRTWKVLAINSGNYVRAVEISGGSIFLGCDYSGIVRTTDEGKTWNFISGPYVKNNRPDRVHAFAVSGANLFAGTLTIAGADSGGVYLSTDNGATWTARSSGLANTNIYALAATGTNVFAGTDTGVYRSTNNGASWTQAGLKTLAINALYASGTEVYAGTDSGVFSSTNDGASWSQINSGLTNLSVASVVAAGTNLLAGTSGGGVFVATDSSINWNTSNTGMAAFQVLSIAVSRNGTGGTNIFAGTQNSGVFLSTDNGSTWTPMNSGLSSPTVNAIAVFGTKIFAGGNNGIFESTDGGKSWSHIRNGIVHSFAVSNTDIFAATGGEGVIRSTDDGTTWEYTMSGGTFYSIVSSGTGLFAVGTATGNGGGVYRSTDEGSTWIPVASTGITSYVISATGTNIFVSTGATNGGVVASTNEGNTWNDANIYPVDHSGEKIVQALMVSQYANVDTILFAGTSGGTYLTTTKGADWTEIPPGSVSSSASNIQTFAISDTTLLEGTDAGIWMGSIPKMIASIPRTIVSNQSSLTFGPVKSNTTKIDTLRITNPSIRPLVIDSIYTGRKRFSVTSLRDTIGTNKWINVPVSFTPDTAKSYSDTLYLLSNSTAPLTKIPLSGSLMVPQIVVMLNGHSLYGYYGGYLTDFGFFFGQVGTDSTKTQTLQITAGSALPLMIDTVYDGTKWFTVPELHDTLNEGDTVSLPISFTPDTSKPYLDTLYIVSNTVVPLTKVALLGNITPVAIRQKAQDMPKNYVLYQNYPNPFNPSTVIQFSVPRSELVSLKVYDVLGRLVRTLVDKMEQPGSYSVTFSASGLASGVYFYRLQAGAFSQTKKLLLLR